MWQLRWDIATVRMIPAVSIKEIQANCLKLSIACIAGIVAALFALFISRIFRGKA